MVRRAEYMFLTFNLIVAQNFSTANKTLNSLRWIDKSGHYLYDQGDIYLFKVINGNNRIMFEIYSKLKIKTLEPRVQDHLFCRASMDGCFSIV